MCNIYAFLVLLLIITTYFTAVPPTVFADSQLAQASECSSKICTAAGAALLKQVKPCLKGHNSAGFWSFLYLVNDRKKL